MRRGILIYSLIACLSVGANSWPLLDFSPDTLKFGYVSVGGSHSRTLSLINVGDQPLAIDSAICNPAFRPHLPANPIMPGDTVAITIDFQPTEIADFGGTIGFRYNNPANPVAGLSTVARGVRSFYPGEPIWIFQHIEDVVCVAATEDYDDDGFPDVVAEGFDAGATGDNLVCFSGSGDGNPNVLWSARPIGGPSNSGGWGDACLNYGSDHNGDGHGDILLGTAWGSRSVFVIDGMTGQTIWSFDTYQNPPSGWIYSVVEANDMNGDGIPEVFAGAGSDCDKVFCFDGATGAVRWQKQAEDAVMSVAALSDINADSFDECTFGAADNGRRMYCVSGGSNGNGVSLWEFNILQSTYCVTTIADINNDGYRDVISGTWAVGSTPSRVIAWNGRRFGNGQVLWQRSFASYIMRVVACPDLNGDGIEDVLVASWENSAYALSGADGSILWMAFGGDDVWAIDYTADVTGDGIVEVIYGSFTGQVFLADGANGNILWNCPTGYKIFSVRGIGDVNGDGFADVIAGTQFLRTEGGKVFLISGGQTATSISDEARAMPDRISLRSYPNPFNSSTVIKFTLPERVGYRLGVYDIAGRLVSEFKGEGVAGENSLIWDVSRQEGVSSGVYLYSLKAGEQSAEGKVTLLR